MKNKLFIADAERLLAASGLPLVSAEARAHWNAHRNDGPAVNPELPPDDRQDEDFCLIRHCYTPDLDDPAVLGVYRKVSAYYDDTGIYDFAITDADDKEVEVPNPEAVAALLAQGRPGARDGPRN